jgi:methylthioribose-1-phosphate isomerase
MIDGLDDLLSGADYSAAELSEDNTTLHVLDQRLLPTQEEYLVYRDVSGAADSIRDMVVRGAPAIGITAAYGMTLAAGQAEKENASGYRAWMSEAAAKLDATRPTAVNLTWATKRCLALVDGHADDNGASRTAQMAALARSIHVDDVGSCRAMGALGAQRLPDDVTVLTHCNAGALATGGYGTALGVIRASKESGKLAQVYATETRPYLQGARLTAWELHRDGIAVTVITDSMVAHCMQQGRIGAVVVGADRIARNGDVANKIGTYGHACLARLHDVPFYVAAPWSTIDLETATGADIVIEERDPGELTRVGDKQLVPESVAVYNPAFDVTPARLVTAIVTERGVFAPADIAGG